MQKRIFNKYDGIERIVVDDGIVLKHDGNVHVLNKTAASIFDLIDGSLTSTQIIESIRKDYNGEDIEKYVTDFFKMLLDAHLIYE